MSLPLSAVHRVTVDRVDVESALREDAAREQQGLPPRFAITNAVRITPDTDGTWENVDDQTLMWRLRISSPGALSINLGFRRYQMPPGGRLLVHSADYRRIIRPFTDLDNETHGELWTPPVLSDDIVVELTIPEASLPALALELGSINVGYRGFGEVSAEKSGSCNVDVVCPEGDGWQDQIPSVAVISLGGGTFCTGFMVNNTAQDRTPYFMTANHCGIDAANAASLVVFWNYQNSTCRPPGSPASGGAGDGSLSQFQTGSFHRAGYGPSDFTLVQLDDAPNPAWNVGFAGWDRSSADSTSAVAIHHPNTDEKRISFENDPTTTTTYLSNPVPGDGTHIRIIDWDLGTTEPGSSGSPLFNQDKRIVGQLHGGFAACGNNDSDWYGRFSVSWTGGGTSSTRLSDWLDPGNTGLMAIDHWGAGMTVTPGEDVVHVGVAGGPFTPSAVTYTLTNPTLSPLDYSVSLTAATFGVLLDGGTTPVTGTLPAGGFVDVLVELDAAVVNVLPTGEYIEDVVFADLTNSTSHTRRHTVEVGLTLFSVSPDSGLESSGPIGGPFTDSLTYTVMSDRPTPFDVEVSASDPWITLNGGPGPITISLAGTGASGTVTVGFSAAADSLPAAIYNATVSFTNQTPGGGGDTTRPVVLDVGRVVYVAGDTPQAINDHETITSVVTVAEGFCVGDVDVDIDITHTWIGDLTVELRSPNGVTVVLHNATGDDADDIVQTYDDEGLVPDGPGTLADFDLQSAAGPWTLFVSDSATGDSGTLNSWSLRIAPAEGVCESPALVYSFPLNSDPGWTVEGEWAFGQPTGGGGEHGNPDPTGGATGTNVYGYNLAGDYPDGLAETHLTSTAIDCSGLSNVSLRFQRWLGVERPEFDHAFVRVSNDGINWTTVWENHSEIADGVWASQVINIASVADNQPTVYLRWTMGATDSSFRYCGWNLDDIEIWGVGGGTFCGTVAPASAEPAAIEKSRYISFVPSVGAGPTAIRVRLTDLMNPSPANLECCPAPDFSAMEGQYRWVGGLAECPDSLTLSTTFKCATLQCAPVYNDWDSIMPGEVLHVTGSAVVPSSLYEVQQILEGCDEGNEADFTDPLTVTTGRWGDVTASFQDPLAPFPATQPDVLDIAAMVDRLRDLPTGTMIKPRAQLQDNAPDPMAPSSVLDVAFTVDAVLAKAYPFTGPEPCN